MSEPVRPPLGPLLITCARLLDEVAQAQVNREAGDTIARPSVMRLLPFLDRQGIRPTDLARRVDVSKQAVGQVLKSFEALGLVEFVPDPTDGRAQLVRLTPAGEGAYRHGNGVLAHLEDALAKAVGAGPVRQLVDGLRAILPVLERWSGDGAPERAVPREVLRFRRGRHPLRKTVR